MTMDKEAKRIYNRKYYETHKGQIKAAQRLSPSTLTPASQEAHREASRNYYRRKKERETPEERKARLQKRRENYKNKKLSSVKPPEDNS